MVEGIILNKRIKDPSVRYDSVAKDAYKYELLVFADQNIWNDIAKSCSLGIVRNMVLSCLDLSCDICNNNTGQERDYFWEMNFSKWYENYLMNQLYDYARFRSNENRELGLRKGFIGALESYLGFLFYISSKKIGNDSFIVAEVFCKTVGIVCEDKVPKRDLSKCIKN